MTEKKFIPYAKQSISEEDIECVKEALLQPLITRGEKVEAFEQAVADYCSAKYAVAFNSGSTALQAAYFAADVKAHDKLITTPNTFISTVGSAILQGADPVFIDIDRTTGNLDVEQLLLNLNHPKSRGKTVIAPVHFAGIAIDMQKIDHFVAQTDTIVIEDAAHAIGSLYKDGSRVGCCTWSQMTIFSFHPAKTITTGEGGLVTTNDPTLYHRLRLYRNNGIEREQEYLQGKEAPWHYEVVSLSGNFNFTEFQAALGLSQLKRIDSFIAKRKKLMQTYKEALKQIDHVTLTHSDLEKTVHHLAVVQIDFEKYKTTKETVMKKLFEKGIGTQFHYIPIYRHPFIANLVGDISEYFPEMEKYYKEALSLPLYADLSEEEVHHVVDQLKKSLS